MSFIYDDKKLIKELLKLSLGQASNAVAPAMTQAVAGTAAEIVNQNKQSLEIAKQLVISLQDQLSGDSFSAEREDAQLFTKHLENLNKLVNFLSYNGIKYNSMLISLDVGEQTIGAKAGSIYYNGLDQVKKALYAPYLTDNNGQPLYYVYKDGLIAYLKDLLGKGNEILNVMVQKIIDEVNRVLQLNIPKELPKQDVPKQDGPAQPGKQTPQAPQAQSASFDQSLAQVIKDLPFRIDNIDFNRINAFFESYKKLLTVNSSIGRLIPIPEAINNARASMIHVVNNSNSSKMTFNISNLTIDSAELWAKDPKGRYLDSLLDALVKVIYYTQIVVQDLNNAYFDDSTPDERKVGGNNHDAYKNLVFQQLNIYQANYNKLREVLDHLRAK